MSAISKSNKCMTYQQKIITLPTNEKHELVGNSFYTRVSYLLDSDMNDMVWYKILFSLELLIDTIVVDGEIDASI